MIPISEIGLTPFNFGGPCEPEQFSGIAAQTCDGAIQTGIWESGPGVLDLHFPWTETVYILEGRAQAVNVRTQQSIELVPGILLLFESGSHWRWHIPWKLKKIFTIIEVEDANTPSQ